MNHETSVRILKPLPVIEQVLALPVESVVRLPATAGVARAFECATTVLHRTGVDGWAITRNVLDAKYPYLDNADVRALLERRGQEIVEVLFEGVTGGGQ